MPRHHPDNTTHTEQHLCGKHTSVAAACSGAQLTGGVKEYTHGEHDRSARMMHWAALAVTERAHIVVISRWRATRVIAAQPPSNTYAASRETRTRRRGRVSTGKSDDVVSFTGWPNNTSGTKQLQDTQARAQVNARRSSSRGGLKSQWGIISLAFRRFVFPGSFYHALFPTMCVK